MTEEQDRAPIAAAPREAGWYAQWLPRVAAATLVAVLIGFGSTWAFSKTSGFLLNIVISVFLSFALLPAVEVLARRGWRRGAAAGVVMIGFAVVAIAFAAAMTQVVIAQVLNLIDRAPEYLRDAADWMESTFGYEVDVDAIIEDISADEERLNELALNATSGILGLASTALGLLFQVLTVALFVFYILADLPRLRNAVLRRFTPERQITIDAVTAVTIEKVGGYVYSRALLALFSAAFHFVVFLVLGVPYAFALALWVGLVSQFIPTIGTYIAGFVPVLIALLEGGLLTVLWVVAAITLYQQVENYLLSPKITANTMQLHPAVAFGSAILGATLLGGIGALIAIPFAAVITALVNTYADHHEVVASSGAIRDAEDYEELIRAKAVERAATRQRRRRIRTLTPRTRGAGNLPLDM